MPSLPVRALLCCALVACSGDDDKDAATTGPTDTATPTTDTPTFPTLPTGDCTPSTTAATGQATATADTADTAMTGATGATGGTTDTATTTATALTGDTAIGTPPTIVDGPQVLEPALVDVVPLARELSVTTVEPTALTVHLDDGERIVHVSFPEVATSHRVPLLGLPADDTVTVTVDLVSDDGALVGQAAGQVDTPPAPSPFPLADVVAHDPERTEPGYLFFSLKSPAPGIDYLLAFDERLRLVWWWDDAGSYGDVRVDPDTATIIGIHSNNATHRDFLGNELLRYKRTPTDKHHLPTPFGIIHHELFPMADGSFWALCYGSTTVAAYPVDYDDPTTLGGTSTIADQCVVHVGADGSNLGTFWASEVLDTTRIGFDGLDLTGDGRDWVHLNGAVPTDDGGVIVSARHQDALYKLDAGGGLEWILSDPAGWSKAFQPYLLTPTGDLTWPYHQHAPALDDDGVLWMFDNHSYGRTPYTPEQDASPEVSRAVGFRVDPVAMTVEQVASFAETSNGELFSPALGDADPQPITGNVLADFGFLDGEEGLLNADLGRGRKSIRLIEFDPDQPTSPALDLRLYSDAKALTEGYKMYRAHKIPSLYPADVTVSCTDY